MVSCKTCWHLRKKLWWGSTSIACPPRSQREVSRVSWHYLEPVVRPAAELHLTILVVEGKPGDVDQAGWLVDATTHLSSSYNIERHCFCFFSFLFWELPFTNSGYWSNTNYPAVCNIELMLISGSCTTTIKLMLSQVLLLLGWEKPASHN